MTPVRASVAAAVGLALVAGDPRAVGAPPAPYPVPVRPNIVLLLADDLSLAVMDYASNATLEDGSFLMPNFRRYIRDKAVEFRQSFSPNPVCCPARATILTGQYSHNHATYTNWIRNGTAVNMLDGSDQTGDGVPDGDTIGFALQRAGYRTAYVGKYLNGYGLMIRSRAGPDRDASYQQQVDRYDPAKTKVLLPVVPETGRTYQPPGWTEWYASLDPTTYCMYNTVFSVDGRATLFHTSGLELDPDNLPDPLPPTGTANYQTDVIQALSLRFLDKHGASPDPLFLSISTLAPHVETCDWSFARLNDVGPLAPNAPLPFTANINTTDQGGQGYRGLFLETVRPAVADLASVDRFKQAAAQLLNGSPSFDEADPSDKPSFTRRATPMRSPYLDGPDGSPDDRYPYFLDPDLFPVPPPAFNSDLSATNPRVQAIDQFARMMASMGAFDRMIGAIAQRLDAQGRLSNTVFVFTSDNGYSYGQHRLSGKLLAYEESIRVPLYVSLPALSQGPVRSWGMVLQTDFAPTLLDLASRSGAPVTMRITPDGTSFKPLLQTPAVGWRKQGLMEHFASVWPDEILALSEHPSLFSVRTSYHNAVVPIRSYTEYFKGMQYGAAPGTQGWPAGFYRVNCRPDTPVDQAPCPTGTSYRVPIRPFIYTPDDSNPDRLPEREYYDLELDPYELTNGFGAGVPTNISDLATAEAPTLKCRLGALVRCAGPTCQTAEWAPSCP